MELKIVFFYVVAEFFVDFVSTKTAWGARSSFMLLSIFTIIEFVSFTTFLYLGIANRIIKKTIAGCAILFSIYLIMSFFQTEKDHFDAIQASGESILIIIFCIIYLFEQINKPPDFLVYSTPGFWVILGFLIYMSGTLFLFIISDRLALEERSKYWQINNFCNIIKNILFSVAFLVSHYSSKHRSIEKPYPDMLENPYENWKP
ncbi:MAG: hypothetical protein P4L51_08815 [Puia sp.]|nr:hypothetical protein [Puia sp.]